MYFDKFSTYFYTIASCFIPVYQNDIGYIRRAYHNKCFLNKGLIISMSITRACMHTFNLVIYSTNYYVINMKKTTLKNVEERFTKRLTKTTTRLSLSLIS